MKVKRHIHFGLREYGKGDVHSWQIRMRVSYAGQRLDHTTGFNLSSPQDWDAGTERVLPRVTGRKGARSRTINAELTRLQEVMESCFAYFEFHGIRPDPADLRKRFLEELASPAAPPRSARRESAGRTAAAPAAPAVPGAGHGKFSRHPKLSAAVPVPDPDAEADTQDVYVVLDRFMEEEGRVREWTAATYQKHTRLKADLQAFRPVLRFDDLTEQTLSEFVHYLREEKVLRTPRKRRQAGQVREREDMVGMMNSGIEKKLFLLKWFLNWATARGYNRNLAYKRFHPKLKRTARPVIYLTRQELAALDRLCFGRGEKLLEQARDVFLFQCFSGLRWSDMNLLRRGDVKADCLMITTEKTEDSLTIELNNVTRRILAKYQGVAFPKDRALPVPSNQKMNILLKEICRRAGIDEPVRLTQYRGQDRIDTYHPKYELVTTHTGRKTFATQCLSNGIPAEIVMKWTGHKDYRAMRPYIAVVDELKAREMKKLDRIGL